jgi:hypothetical protein
MPMMKNATVRRTNTKSSIARYLPVRLAGTSHDDRRQRTRSELRTAVKVAKKFLKLCAPKDSDRSSSVGDAEGHGNDVEKSLNAPHLLKFSRTETP